MESVKQKYLRIKIHQILMFLVVIGALNWGATAFKFNLVKMLNSSITSAFGKNYKIDKIIYVVIGIAALFVLFNRNTWLPFLGETVLPGSLIPLKQTKGDTSVVVHVKPNSRVAYWSSLPSNTVPDVTTAYGDYSNAGVVMSDANGNATLVINKGSSYIVPSGMEIPKHIHYRLLDETWGMIGPIKTVFY
jgi:uncharacterized membrane protein YuzA (DUF378 family)